jgi:hypothetical protein
VVASSMIMSTWNDLANGARWRGVVSFIRNWVGPFDSNQGMTPDELDQILRAKRLTLPAAVREWYLLAANWNPKGLNVWFRPAELEVCDGMIEILTDPEGISNWSIRVVDFDIEDPPVVSPEENPNDIEFQSFSEFVAAMIINDVLFADETTGEPVELNHDAARTTLMCIVSSGRGDFFGDAPLESATVVMWAISQNSPAFGKSRTLAGRALLNRLQR